MAKWNWIKEDGLPPEEKTVDGVGTGQSVPVLINFKKNTKPYGSLTGHFFQVGVWDFMKSKWIMFIGGDKNPQLEFIEAQSKALGWKLILLPKENRPNDNQKIKFTTLSGKTYMGIYVKSEDMFAYDYTNDVVDGWEYGWNILNWKPHV